MCFILISPPIFQELPTVCAANCKIQLKIFAFYTQGLQLFHSGDGQSHRLLKMSSL